MMVIFVGLMSALAHKYFGLIGSLPYENGDLQHSGFGRCFILWGSITDYAPIAIY